MPAMVSPSDASFSDWIRVPLQPLLLGQVEPQLDRKGGELRQQCDGRERRVVEFESGSSPSRLIRPQTRSSTMIGTISSQRTLSKSG